MAILSKLRIFLLSLPYLVSLLSCQNHLHSLKPKEFVKYIEDQDNGISTEKIIGDISYSLQYKPYEYIAIKELKKEKINSDELAQKIDEIKGLQYFDFKISNLNMSEDILRKNLSNENEFEQRIRYFSFEMQNDLKLIDCSDTLDCNLFHFERTYGLSSYTIFLLGFPINNSVKIGQVNLCNKTLLYIDKIFNQGKIFITIESDNIKNIPKIITD
jgi:hypothetical protein